MADAGGRRGRRSRRDIAARRRPIAGAVCYGGEAALAYAARWPLSLHSPVAWLVRDLLLIPLWVAGWFGNEHIWRGNQMDLADEVLLEAAAEPGE